MPRNVAALRAEIAAHLAPYISAPFEPAHYQEIETVSAGISALDGLTGGLPRGAITEFCGLSGSGRTSLLMSALASRTAAAEACALIDARDAFDPYSAQATGVQLPQLLWVRCRNIDQALRATDLVLHAGGFGLVVLDLGDVPPKVVRDVPLNVWFRFRRAVEHTPTILLVLEQEPHAKTCASLVLRLEAEAARWLKTNAPDVMRPPHARLLAGALLRAEVVRNRAQPASRAYFHAPAVRLESQYRASSLGLRLPVTTPALARHRS